MPPKKTQKPELQVEVLEAPTYNFSDLERIVGICHSQLQKTQALVPQGTTALSTLPTQPLRFSGETILGLASRLGLDPNVVCRVMQDYAEGKYPQESKAIVVEKPKEPSFYKSTYQTIKDGVMPAGDVVKSFIGEVWDEHSTSIVVVGVIAALCYGTCGVIVPAVKSSNEAYRQALLDRSEAVYKQDLPQIEKDAQLRMILTEAIGYYDDVENRNSEELSSAVNQYYTALQESKYSVTEGIQLLRVLDEYSYSNDPTELGSAASTYVQALGARGMRLKESFSYISSVEEATSNQFGAPELVDATIKFLGEAK